MVSYLLFIVYVVLFCWLITKLAFFRNATLPVSWLLVLYILKIAAGIAYALYYAQPAYLATSDTWNYYKASLVETDWLLHNPAGFIKDLFVHQYADSGNLFNNNTSYWNDLKSNSIIKLIAVINVFTAKNYYANIVWFNFLYLFGPVALYRIAARSVKVGVHWLVFPVFLLPSFLFWCSGVHKDGLVFSAMLLAVWTVQVQLQRQRWLLSYCVLLVACFAVLFALRNFVLLLLMPALVALVGSSQKPNRAALIFGGVYGVCLLLFFGAKYIHPLLNFPAYLVGKQAEFNLLSGKSKVEVPPLQPTISSFLSYFPHAVDMAFWQPHPSQAGRSIPYWLAIAENMLMLLLIGVASYFSFHLKKIQPFLYFLLFFGLSLYLLSGYTVTFAGAIVRYKSIAGPLLATALFIIFSRGWVRRKRARTKEQISY